MLNVYPGCIWPTPGLNHVIVLSLLLFANRRILSHFEEIQ